MGRKPICAMRAREAVLLGLTETTKWVRPWVVWAQSMRARLASRA